MRPGNYGVMNLPLDDQIRQVLARHPCIRAAYLFGSLATGRARPDSDLDLAVLAAQVLSTDEKSALIGALAELTGRPVDLVDLAVAGEPLLGQVLVHGRRILGSDLDHARLIRRHVFEQADFLPYRNRILADRRRAWIGK
jgi:predicted nucleotidyltransferase